MFETQSNICYDNGINLGRAVVFMNRNNHAAKIDFIYMVDKMITGLSIMKMELV